MTASTLIRTVSAFALGAATLMPAIASAQIDEIITTAQRRAQSTQDIPVAVTVLTAEDLETKQVGNTVDLQKFVPNINIGTNTGTASAPRIFLRGIGEDESRGAVEPAVGTYIDGVYIGRLIGAQVDLLDLEQVEVLRGPQGTLYGRNSNGGAIKITSVKPQQETSGSAKFTYGNYDRLDAKGSINFAPTDTTAVRLSALYKTRDGYVDLAPNGVAAGDAVDGVGDTDVLAFRGAISQDIGDWNVLISADYTDNDSEPVPSTRIGAFDDDDNIFTGSPGTATCTAPAAPGVGALFDTRPSGCFAGYASESISQGISATVTGDLGNMQLQSISSFRRLDDELDSFIGFPFAQETDQEQISQEVTLSSLNAGPFNYVIGGFYFKEDLNLDSTFVFPFRVTSDTESIAVFGQGSYEVTDRLTLTGGLRYTDETRDFAGINFFSGLTNAQETDLSKVSYTAKVDYDLTDNVLAFASYSTGFKGNGFSPDCFSPVACFLPVDEEEVKTFEAGFKSRIWDDRLQFNTTYFRNDYSDLQIASSVPGLGFTRFNVDETLTQGFEFELLFQPTDNFELSANLGLLDSEYKELTLAQAGGLSNNGLGCPGGVVTIQCGLDLELKNAPDYKANIAAVYTKPVASGDITFSGDISFEDDSFNLVANAPQINESDIPTLLNGRIAYAPESGFWNVGVWAKNILDEDYFRASTFSAGVSTGYPAEPATYGVDIGFNF